MAMPSSSAPQSWLPSANSPDTDFPLTHLPYGAFRYGDEQHLCVAIGSHLVDLYRCAGAGLLPASLITSCRRPVLNQLMSLGPSFWELLRNTLTSLLEINASTVTQQAVQNTLYPIQEATLLSPVHIPNYTDFYASIHHARRVGELFRPDQPLLPNYKYIPIAYHGRASSIVPNNTSIIRPRGQVRPASPEDRPAFKPTNALDFELELAFYIGQSNPLGSPVPIDRARESIFGVSILNDWSARDIQAWEYQPLGPFLGKNFATTISPWVTPLAALEPFRTSISSRANLDPEPLPYIFSVPDQQNGALDITLETYLLTPKMRESGMRPFSITKCSAKDLYWSPAQLVAHHTSNGCNLQVGDVLATGTISGREISAAGCLLELTRNGADPIFLPTGETRTFLQDEDEIILRGFCERAGYPRIGLGECRGRITSTQFAD